MYRVPPVSDGRWRHPEGVCPGGEGSVGVEVLNRHLLGDVGVVPGLRCGERTEGRRTRGMARERLREGLSRRSGQVNHVAQHHVSWIIAIIHEMRSGCRAARSGSVAATPDACGRAGRRRTGSGAHVNGMRRGGVTRPAGSGGRCIGVDIGGARPAPREAGPHIRAGPADSADSTVSARRCTQPFRTCCRGPPPPLNLT